MKVNLWTILFVALIHLFVLPRVGHDDCHGIIEKTRGAPPNCGTKTKYNKGVKLQMVRQALELVVVFPRDRIEDLRICSLCMTEGD